MSPSLYALLIGPFESFSFMRIALVACLALALANGPLGILLLLRRMALDGNVLSHAVMPGAALGFVYAGHSLTALSTGGLASGALVAGLTGLLGRDGPMRQEAALIAFYLVTLALGVTLVALFGSNVDTVRVLFGTVLAIDVRALLQIATVCTLTMLLLALFYRPMAVDSFDPVFLRMAGGNGMRGLFVVLLLLNLVVSFQAFGTLLAIGPMLLPAAAARCWTQRPGVMIVLASSLGMLSCYAGLLLSYHRNLPSGPAIVMTAGAVYGISLLLSALMLSASAALARANIIRDG
ncbi:MAG: zinc/manganese transport system permease protein [Acetobacteraceae bacterium]|nr:zinc/manganese transport system permease protein [Acetobacteraceae bacterium]